MRCAGSAISNAAGDEPVERRWIWRSPSDGQHQPDADYDGDQAHDHEVVGHLGIYVRHQGVNLAGMVSKRARHRQELQNRDGTRFRCRATVDRFGTKSAFQGPPIPTILLRNVTDEAGTLLTDHLWFTCGRWSADLAIGDNFEFDARVAEYTKGYQGLSR